jgi:FkbM family methyltransferase
MYPDVTRLCGDTWSVLRVARPGSAARWLAGLAIRTPEVARSRTLAPADRAWTRSGARFRTPGGRTVVLPGERCAGAREMYCRNVYLRTGLRIPPGGWVVDLGANAGLFTVLAAVEGARVVAVEAQRGFVAEIERLLALNQVEADRVRIEVALATSANPEVALVGVVADEQRWRSASHAGPDRPAGLPIPELMSRHGIDRIGLLKVDIEGSEFSLFHPDAGIGWLARVDQVAMEVHPEFGGVAAVRDLLVGYGFTVTVTGNEGRPVPPSAPDAAYLYAAQRPQQHH